MAKKPKRVNRSKKSKKHIKLWAWIVISIPIVVAVIWAISIITTYRQLPLVYEQASPSSIKTVLALIFTFIISYGAFVFMEFKKTISDI
ncbi:MAG: hypothetical protein KJ561_08405 [Nanoarchaeota archaeon]|nr:hypothetical protein [Nanoarchaeota archaeon]